MNETPLLRRDLAADELMRDFPPRFQHSHKKLIFKRACPEGTALFGKLVFSRWREIALPERFAASKTILEKRSGAFAYEPEPSPTIAWYLNFADRDLFCAYGGRLLAQDELQVLEHPVLGSLREMLVAGGERPVTVEAGRPTPILVMGAERRCAIDTAKLYGNRFAKASTDEVLAATRILSPTTITNIIAMEAPSGGRGIYRRSEIEFILATAFTGFSAARIEAERILPNAVVAIHTGFWGCGAYGGHRVLMAALQLLAARLANVDRIIFHTFDRTGGAALEEANTLVDRLARQDERVADSVGAIDALEFAWGVSDGT